MPMSILWMPILIMVELIGLMGLSTHKHEHTRLIFVSMNMSWMYLLMRLTWISISMVVVYKGT